jgi:hypothetical protein
VGSAPLDPDAVLERIGFEDPSIPEGRRAIIRVGAARDRLLGGQENT